MLTGQSWSLIIIDLEDLILLTDITTATVLFPAIVFVVTAGVTRQEQALLRRLGGNCAAGSGQFHSAPRFLFGDIVTVRSAETPVMTVSVTGLPIVGGNLVKTANPLHDLCNGSSNIRLTDIDHPRGSWSSSGNMRGLDLDAAKCAGFRAVPAVYVDMIQTVIVALRFGQ